VVYLYTISSRQDESNPHESLSAVLKFDGSRIDYFSKVFRRSFRLSIAKLGSGCFFSVSGSSAGCEGIRNGWITCCRGDENRGGFGDGGALSAK